MSDNDFKYLTENIGSKYLGLLKQKELIHMSTWTILKELVKKNCLIEKIFTAL